MKTPRFEYHAPDTVDEALALLQEHGDDAKVLAGGQSLIPLLALRLARPAQLVDLNRISSLSRIEATNGAVSFGAMVRERDAERSDVVQAQVPLLAEALPHIGHVAIRNRGTMGGSVAHADAAAEIPTVTLALEGEVTVRSTRGERTVAAADLFQGHYTTALDDDELLMELRLPVRSPRSGWSFEEVARRHGDFALVGAAALVTLDEAGSITESRVALMGVADRPIRAIDAEASLSGNAPTAAAFAAAAAAAASPLDPTSDVHGSAAYRRHLTEVVVRRALAKAAERAATTTSGAST